MGDSLYDKRKRLERENALLREQQHNARLKREAVADELADLGIAAFKAFLAGKANLVVTDGNREGERVVYFQMPTIE